MNELTTLERKLFAELFAAHRIIRNGLACMDSDAKFTWGALNARDGVCGEGITRANEREHAIQSYLYKENLIARQREKVTA